MVDAAHAGTVQEFFGKQKAKRCDFSYWFWQAKRAERMRDCTNTPCLRELWARAGLLDPYAPARTLRPTKGRRQYCSQESEHKVSAFLDEG